MAHGTASEPTTASWISVLRGIDGARLTFEVIPGKGATETFCAVFGCHGSYKLGLE